MQQFLISIKNFMDPAAFTVIILIAIFEFLVDRPALKRQGLIKDAKITFVISIVWVVSAIAMAFTARLVR